MQIKITETITAVIELNEENYGEDDRTPEGMLRVERENAKEWDYMEMVGADSREIVLEVVEEG